MKILSHLLPLLVFLLAISPAYAMTTRGGNSVYIPKDEIIAGSLFAGGNSVSIDGVVHGDVFCGAQSVVVSGTVDGDVICAAQSIRIAGAVGGSVRGAAQAIDIAGSVKRNVTAVGQTITVDPTGSITGEILAAAQSISVYGNVGGDISAAVESLTFGGNAKVAGSVKYESKTAATVAPTATIAGTLVQTTPKPEQKSPVVTAKKVRNSANGVIGKIIFYLIVAFIVNAVASKWTKKVLDTMGGSPLRLGLRGFVAVLVGAMIIILMAITIIGIPFAILGGILFGLTLLLSEVFATLFVGRYILERFNTRDGNMYKIILVGVPVTCILFAIPVIGGLAGFLGVTWGFGAILASRKK